MKLKERRGRVKSRPNGYTLHPHCPSVEQNCADQTNVMKRGVSGHAARRHVFFCSAVDIGGEKPETPLKRRDQDCWQGRITKRGSGNPATVARIRKVAPDCGLSCSRSGETPSRAEVTNMVERSGPPKAMLVILSARKATLVRHCPSGVQHETFAPAQCATQMCPSRSTVIPSG